MGAPAHFAEGLLPVVYLGGEIQANACLFSALTDGAEPYARLFAEIPPRGVRFAFPVRVYVPGDGKKAVWEHLEEIPPEILERIRIGEAKLILDSSGEGRHIKDHVPEELHRKLDQLRVPLGQVVLLSQNLLVRSQYKRWQKETGTDEGIRIRMFHSFLWILLNAVEKKSLVEECGRRLEWITSEAFLQSSRAKKFLCLNFTPRDHRVAVLLYILRRSLVEDGYISFPGLNSPKFAREDANDVAIRKISWYADDLLEALPELRERSPFTLDVPLDVKSDTFSDIGDFQYYRDSYFSMVTESDVNSRNRRRFTEKIFKPVLGGHPFLLLGLAHSLEDFRALGFKTFHPWINEHYDTIVDTKERTSAVFSEFSRLCAFTPKQWSVLLEQLQEVILHNFRWFTNQLRAIVVREQLDGLRKELGM